MKRLRAVLPLLLLLLAGTVLFVSGLGGNLTPVQLASQHASLLQHVNMHPWLSRLVYVGVLTVVTATGVPGSLLVIIAGGLVFGEVQGIALSSMGLVLGSLLLFLASRYAFGCQRGKPGLVERLRHGYAAHPVNYTFFLRLVPVFPFGGVTVALAWLRCPLGLFVLSTFLGGSLMLIFETAIGAELGQTLASHQSIDWHLLIAPRMLLPLGALALLALLPLAWHRRRTPPDHAG